MIYQIKKIYRYIQLHGLKRTLQKIITFMHNKNILINYKFIDHKINDKGSFVSIIGCGNFAFSTISFFLSEKNKNFLVSCFDTDKNKSKSLSKYFGGKFVQNIEEILEDRDIKLVYISSNHSTHCEYAIACIKNNKNVHIEKPHVINFNQLKNLNQIMRQNPKVKVFLGFNRPFSKFTNILKKNLNKEKGYNISNFFILGHKLDKSHWYYKSGEGSRAISNLCHWSDLLIYLTPYKEIFPISIIPCSPKDSSNFSISIIFNNKSFSNLIFTSNANSFEGVRESINIQRGDLYAKIIDYKFINIVKDQKVIYSEDLKKDQGHQMSIVNSYDNVSKNLKRSFERKYIVLTGYFFLKIDESLRKNKKMNISEKEFLLFYNK